MTLPAPPPLPVRTTWWDRNWKWVAILLTLVSAVTVVAAIAGVGALLKRTEPFQIALAGAKQHAGVIELLGAPVAAGWLVTGKVNYVGDRGTAELSGSLVGPKGSAGLQIVGQQTRGVWEVRVKVHPKGGGPPIELSGRSKR